jgi:hypothetical protein
MKDTINEVHDNFMSQKEQTYKNSNTDVSTKPEILEQGDIFFFYRPKVRSEQVRGIEDIRRFFMVLAPDEEQELGKIYRLFVIGKKSLPEIRESEARSSERYWARVGGIFEDPKELANNLQSDEFRKGDAARPVGEGKYAIIKHRDHAELAYILELPKEPGEAQKELGIEKEASYIITVINPNKPAPKGYPSAEESPTYPDSVLKEFSANEDFIPLSKNLKLIDYQNAQIILIGSREGRDVIKNEMAIEIEENENQQEQTAEIFTKLKIQRDKVPTKPLIEGKLE